MAATHPTGEDRRVSDERPVSDAVSGPDRSRLPLREANPHPVQPTFRRLARVGGWLLRRLTRQDWDAAA